MMKLTFYPNSRGVWVGDLAEGDTRLLATTHPATIAAAMVAMNEASLVVQTERGSVEMAFPLTINDFVSVVPVILDPEMMKWMHALFELSQVDFVHPDARYEQADIHFRTAVHHLPERLVKVWPTKPESKDFRKQLKKRNQYVYYPDC